MPSFSNNTTQDSLQATDKQAVRFTLLTVLSFALIDSIWAQSAPDCMVITGNKRDGNDALTSKLFTKTDTKIGGRNCKLVDGWDEAIALTKNLPLGSELLLVQGAHGLKDSTFACNSGDITANEILTHLDNLSKKYKLGAVIHSCFSGEIMRKKLIRDQFTNEGIENLCLVTSSQFNRLTYSHAKDIAYHLENASPGQSLEDIFLKSHSGLISSAAWTESGVASYLTNRDVREGMNVLQNLDKITRYDGLCDTPAKISSAICASPSVSSEVFELLSVFKEPIVKNDLKFYTVTNLQNKIEKLAKENQTDGANCYRGILNFYQNKYGEKLERLNRLTELRPAFEEFSKLPAYKTCQSYKPKLDDWSQKTLYFQSFTMALEEYDNAQDRLSRIFKTHRFDENFDFSAFGKAAAGDKRECSPESKIDILHSLLGESFFKDEYASFWDPSIEDIGVPDENILGKEFSTQIALKGFQNSSILRNSPQNPTDKARSKACKNFKL